MGRSTVTAALAQLAKSRGRRVLVAEVGDDPKDYSPLARCFGRDRFALAPELIEPGLLGVMFLARTGQELFLKEILHSATLARAAVGNQALRRLLSAGPSFREMGVFFQLLTYLRATRSDGQREHELILIDMPATGHTLSLTGLPDVLLKLMPRGPISASLREGKAYLNDPAQTAAWLVTLPETLPVSESLELIEGLRKTEVPTGGIFVNRMPRDPFTPDERATLTPLLAQHDVLGRESFNRPLLAARETSRLLANTPLPVYPLPELPHDQLIAAITTLLATLQPITRVSS